MTSDDFRRLALEMAGAIESSHMNHPDFRAHGRIFATLHHNDEWGMVKVTPEEQRELMRAHPTVFVPSAGAWGRQGCTNVRLAAADERTVRAAMLIAWENSAGTKVTKGRSSRRRARAASEAVPRALEHEVHEAHEEKPRRADKSLPAKLCGKSFLTRVLRQFPLASRRAALYSTLGNRVKS